MFELPITLVREVFLIHRVPQGNPSELASHASLSSDAATVL